MNSSADREDYSTLEVDTEAHTRNQYAETNHAAQLPQFNYNADAYVSYPEVVGGDAIKKDVDPTLPEPVHVPVAGEAVSQSEQRICGMKRKIFWAVLIVVVVAIIAIVAGVVAGVVTRRNRNSDSDSDSTNNQNESSELDDNALLPNTNIATTNFTDQFGYENYLVAYQLNNRAIYLSTWNSSHRSWVVSPIVDGKTNNLGFDSVRKGTALALDVFAYNTSSRDIHVYWQLPDSGGLATIKALSYNSEKGISTESSIPTANWIDSAAGNSYISTAGSSLVSYGKQCDLCNQYSYLYWQTPEGIREASFQNSSTGWHSDKNVIKVNLPPPAENSSLAQTHAAAATTAGHRSMNIFYRSTTSGLSQIVNGDGRYVGHTIGRSIGPGTTIAAFSTGFNETSRGWAEPLGFQVLTADPTTDDGVQLTYYKGNSWNPVSDQVRALSDCKDRGKMAANRARRIYCLVGRRDNKVEIVEYAWRGDPDDVSTYLNYDKIGAVSISL